MLPIISRDGPALAVEDGAARLAGALAVLRELVHQHAGRLAEEPRLEVKGLLAAHLHDDAQDAAALARRLAELGCEASAGPGPEAGGALDAAAGAEGPGGYLAAAYGMVKPRLAAGLRDHLAQLDPLADEPGMRLVVALAHRQEHHVAELDCPRAHARAPLEPAAGPPRELPVRPAVAPPAREPYIRLGAPADPLHARLHAAMCAAERSARLLHEHPEQPWALRTDLARLAWDGMRHAAALERALVAHGRFWGADAVRFPPEPPGDQPAGLAALAAAAEAAGALPPGVPPALSEHLRADAAFHAVTCAAWGRRLLGDDEAAWVARVREARAALAAAR